MQNEPYWYNEKDDDYFMTPNFEGPDFFGSQSEDKFVMTAETENQHDHYLALDHNYEDLQLEGNGGYMDKACLYNHPSVGDENVAYSEGYCHMNNKDQFEGDPTSFNYPSLKEINLNDFHLKVVEDITSFDTAPQHTVNQSFDYYTRKDSSEVYKGPYDLTIKVSETDLPNGLDNYEARDGGELAEESQDPEIAAAGEDNTDDELLKYIQEDEYEVFDLRIIHRKNRFV